MIESISHAMLEGFWSHIDWRLTLGWALACVPWDMMDTIMYRGRNSIISFLPRGLQAWMVHRIDFDDDAPIWLRLWDAATAMFRTGWHFFKALFLLGLILLFIDATQRAVVVGWQQGAVLWGTYGIVHGLLYGSLFRLRRQ